MHVIDSIYEWFSSHFLECEYRSSIASIRLVYEVATSHRANLILEYASPPPARASNGGGSERSRHLVSRSEMPRVPDE